MALSRSVRASRSAASRSASSLLPNSLFFTIGAGPLFRYFFRAGRRSRAAAFRGQTEAVFSKTEIRPPPINMQRTSVHRILFIASTFRSFPKYAFIPYYAKTRRFLSSCLSTGPPPPERRLPGDGNPPFPAGTRQSAYFSCERLAIRTKIVSLRPFASGRNGTANAKYPHAL